MKKLKNRTESTINKINFNSLKTLDNHLITFIKDETKKTRLGHIKIVCINNR